jgi:hypothetical protein
MRPREEIEERLRVLTQALYFSHAHRGELSEEARVKLRILEENISLLQWCLSDSDAPRVTWGTVREAFQFFLRVLGQKLSPPRAGDAGSSAGNAQSGR